MKVFHHGSGGGTPREPSRSETREPRRAILRGFRGLCPECGAGALFDGYLTVRPTCKVCGEAFHHHRADDLPPYLTILVVGHVVVSGLLVTEKLWQPADWVQAAIWLPVTLLLSLLLVRPFKGAVVALQWAFRMHGFAKRPPAPFDPSSKAS